MSDLRADDALEVARNILPGEKDELITLRGDIAKELIKAYYSGAKDGFNEAFQMFYPKEVSHVN